MHIWFRHQFHGECCLLLMFSSTDKTIAIFVSMNCWWLLLMCTTYWPKLMVNYQHIIERTKINVGKILHLKSVKKSQKWDCAQRMFNFISVIPMFVSAHSMKTKFTIRTDLLLFCKAVIKYHVLMSN